MSKKKININMPEEFVEKLDNISKANGMNRSSLINMIVKQYLDKQEEKQVQD